MTIFKNITFLLNKKYKKKLNFIIFLMIIGLFFEMLSIGILIPFIAIIINPRLFISKLALYYNIELLNKYTNLQLSLLGISVLLMIYTIKSLYLIYLNWQQSSFISNLSADLSKTLFFNYIAKPYSFFLNQNSAILLRNVQGEVDQFMAFSQSLLILIVEISVVFGISLVLLIAEPLGAICTITIITLTSYIFYKQIKSKVQKWGSTRLISDGNISQILLETFGVIKDIKLLNKENYFKNKFLFNNRNKANVLIKQNTIIQIPRLYLELIAIFSLSLIILIKLLNGDQMNNFIPTLGIFVASAFRLLPSVNKIMTSLQNMRYSYSSVKQLTSQISIINNDTEDFEEFKNEQFANFSKIIFNNIYYRYAENRLILNNINFEINKGDIIGIIGESGSGKSTLVDLILGFHKQESGNIFFNEKLVSNQSLNWKIFFGYVPQNIYLIDSSIKANIALGIDDDKIDNNKIHSTIVQSQLENLINELDDGINTFVGERGVRLSGGQRQRIGIARALYNNPEILILDEATSALDESTEKEVMNSINKLKGNKTIIIISHRITTLSICNKVFELKDGKLKIIENLFK
jgi:ABC-type multidrug transport system fused ATPase/permease subunit